MSIHRFRPSRRDAERLLDDPAAHGSALGTLLSAAAAPALPGELRREDVEAAAFQRARVTPSTGTPTIPSSRRGGRAAVRAVVATGAVVALTTGGLALANSAHLPGLADQASDQASASVAKTPKPSDTPNTSAEAPESESESPESESPETETETPESESPETEAPETGSSTPTPNFDGLCKAFQARDHSANGSSLDSAAFTALATEAGGAANIATYCVALIGEPKETGKPSVLPTPTSKPTPTSRPTDKPTPTAPAGKPSSAPGKPTDKPTPSKGGGKKP